jgi:signal peptidase II
VKRPLLIILLIIIADQALKVWVKLNMFYDSSIPLLGSKGYLHFIENPGMAFGMQLPTETGKLLLSLFRIAVLIGLGWYMTQQIRKDVAPKGLVVSLSLIFAGALGNIIDSAFYGMIFSESTRFQLAEFLPEDGGYATFLHGEVVDMFYFPLFDGEFPEWLPIWGGEPFLFFRPVFNIADASISVGVGMLILFQRHFFKGKPELVEQRQEETDGTLGDLPRSSDVNTI